ncbi:MAG: peptidylprolyl isomerase [Collinsella sp.]
MSSTPTTPAPRIRRAMWAGTSSPPFVDSYQAALGGLNKGDVSDVVESTYGYHIIKCTDYFHVDNQVDDIKQVPKDIKKYVSTW